MGDARVSLDAEGSAVPLGLVTQVRLRNLKRISIQFDRILNYEFARQ